jgi:methylmalonyl-CoA mutase cobalamin-binding subunit
MEAASRSLDVHGFAVDAPAVNSTTGEIAAAAIM